MALSRLGDFIELTTEVNSDNFYGPNDVRGMTITKEIIATKADVSKTDLSKFLIIKPNEFIYNPRTHGKRIGLGYNDTTSPFLISWNNIGFRVKIDKIKELEPTYLFIYLKRIEWDRWATFCSWGSSTEVFAWDTFCDMKLTIPPIEIQRKYVAIYKALKDNLKVYQSKLDDIKTVLDSSIENLKKEYPLAKIGPYLTVRDVRNRDNSIKNVKGVTVYKTFREPTSKVNKEELSNYKIVKPMDIAFVQTTHNEKVFAFALNDTNEQIVVSSVNEVFFTDTNYLLPEYLSLFFSRKEFDRYARFHSWGSARETFTMEDVKNVMIPIPNLIVQENFAKLRQSYIKRKQILDKLKEKINNICPILIRGAVREAKNGVD